MSKEEVNHPDHYNSSEAKCLGCGRQIECIDVIEVMPANCAMAVKYLWRMDHKHDNPIIDLDKAIWYLNRERERIQRKLGRDMALRKAPKEIADIE